MIKSHGLLHFTIPVKDLDRSEKFYKEIFGFDRIRRQNRVLARHPMLIKEDQ